MHTGRKWDEFSATGYPIPSHEKDEEYWQKNYTPPPPPTAEDYLISGEQKRDAYTGPERRGVKPVYSGRERRSVQELPWNGVERRKDHPTS